jgi:hypothetical protein
MGLWGGLSAIVVCGVDKALLSYLRETLLRGVYLFLLSTRQTYRSREVRLLRVRVYKFIDIVLCPIYFSNLCGLVTYSLI